MFTIETNDVFYRAFPACNAMTGPAGHTGLYWEIYLSDDSFYGSATTAGLCKMIRDDLHPAT
jgi:hypothetical protein